MQYIYLEGDHCVQVVKPRRKTKFSGGGGGRLQMYKKYIKITL